MPAQTVIKVRRDTAANWISVDPTLASGEIGFETDTNLLKIGNGTDEWTVLPYASGAGGASVEISETAPAEPEEGDVWFNSTDGRAYIYYDSTWVDLNPGIAGPAGAAGIAIQTGEPESTDVLWLDTDETPDVPVPAGGTDGQVLTKTSSADYATAWENIPEGTAVVSSTTEPEDTGAIWYNTENGNAYIYYDGFWASITGPGVPSGGTTGQILAKSSSADYATEWVAPSALTLLNTTSFSAVASQSIDGVFTSTYDNYKILLNFTCTGNVDIAYRMRASGVDNTTNYQRQLLTAYGTTVQAARDNNAFIATGNTETLGQSAEIIFYNPNKANNTTSTSLFLRDFPGVGMELSHVTGIQRSSAQFDGIKFFPTSGTFTGTLSIYGLAK